jgi:mono/diheme cytochrome c family protein
MTKNPQSKMNHLVIIAAALCAAITVACGAASTPPPPTATLAPPTATPEPRPKPEVLAAGKAAFIRIGCVACHAIKGISDQALAAPPLDDAYHLVLNAMKSPEYKASGAKAKTPKEFIEESILLPDAFTYPTCPQGPCIKGTMPSNYKDIIRSEEMEPLVQFLLWQGR